jgi:hypothetical protein
MLWSQFFANCLPIFGEKLKFFFKNKFLQKVAVIWAKNPIFCQMFGRKYLKIITSVPGRGWWSHSATSSCRGRRHQWVSLLKTFYSFKIFLKTCLWPMPLLLLSTHRQCILHVILYTTALLCFPKNLIPTLAGFKHGSSSSWGVCDVLCATPPRL